MADKKIDVQNKVQLFNDKKYALYGIMKKNNGIFLLLMSSLF